VNVRAFVAAFCLVLPLTVVGVAGAAPQPRSATLTIPAVITYGDHVDPVIVTTGREQGTGYFYQYVWCSQPGGGSWETPTNYSRDVRFSVDEFVTFTNGWANAVGSTLTAGRLDPAVDSSCAWSVYYSHYKSGGRQFELDLLAQERFTLWANPNPLA